MDGPWSPRKALQTQMEALANKEAAAKEKEEKQNQAVEAQRETMADGRTRSVGVKKQSCLVEARKFLLMYQEKGGGALCKLVLVLCVDFFWGYEQERLNYRGIAKTPGRKCKDRLLMSCAFMHNKEINGERRHNQRQFGDTNDSLHHLEADRTLGKQMDGRTRPFVRPRRRDIETKLTPKCKSCGHKRGCLSNE